MNGLATAFLIVGVAVAGFVAYFFLASFAFGAGYEPTGRSAVETMLRLSQLGPQDLAVDLGAGTGAIAFRAARERGPRVVAVEIEPLRVLILRLRRHLSRHGDRVTVVRRDLFRYDLTGATVVYAFLWPRAMSRLREKLERELAPGARVVSHYHPVPGWTPEARQGAVWAYRLPDSTRPISGGR